MKKSMILIFVFATSLSWGQFNSITASSPKSFADKYKIGVGINYTYPSSGLSCRVGFNDEMRGQISLAFRGYGDYSWNYVGVEFNYVFNKTNLELGDLESFGYAGIGRGSIVFNSAIYGFDNYHWLGYNLGVGVEFFPDAFKKKIGVISKLGFGSYGTFGAETAVATGLLYGGAIHYYIK